MKYILNILAAATATLLIGCGPAKEGVKDAEAEWIDLSKRDKPSAITQNPWHEVVINVAQFEDLTPFFQEIAGFEILDQTADELRLGAPNAESGFIRLKRIGDAPPARPASSRAWDKGCYFSLMMRAKNLPSIIEDAAPLGWTPLTDMAYLEFGASKLHIVVLTHKSGMRVQLYERLNRPIPEGFTPFERISRPFNIMQMVEDRDVGYDFFQQKLGFDTHFYGPSYTSEKEEVMPLGIPPKLTTSIPYLTGIMTPKSGNIYGRMEMIDIQGMKDSVNYADRCDYNHTGIVAVRFEVEELGAVRKNLRARKVDIIGGDTKSLRIKTPDGANIEFYRK
ncbi:MAG: hypothetical protein ABJN69_07280 [Hellea sp.]